MLTTFSVGQVWQYQTRPHENNSRLIIVRIDADDNEFGNIIHIYISDVDIPNAEAPEGKTTYIGHMPYEEGALESSVTKKESESADLPDYEDGYQLWKSAFDQNQAGIFDVPVSEAIDFVQQSI